MPQEYREKHVGFCDDDSDEPIDIEGKLRRRDTPHHLKNKRINSMETPESAEEKVRAIMAAVGQKRPGSPPPPKVCALHCNTFYIHTHSHITHIGRSAVVEVLDSSVASSIPWHVEHG